ncbi:hypothetical protein GN956_G7557 [Arapaima gigas]
MGCSPSKGKFSTGASGPFNNGKVLLPGSQETLKESLSIKGVAELNGISSVQTEPLPLGTEIKLPAQQENLTSTQERRLSLDEMTPSVMLISDNVGIQEADVEMLSKHDEIKADPLREEQQEENPGLKTRKTKTNSQRNKGKSFTTTPSEIEIPSLLTKAHLDAYTFTNPTVSKYDSLMDLLDQARQTYLALQPMAALMVLRYEEVNHELEEMADEGEMMLKQYEEYLALAQHGSSEPIDLLQQMIQYSSDNIKLASDSIGSLGDSALEEAVDHFTSLSTMLDERLKVKRVAERRLVQVLARIKVIALHKRHGPEDSSLYSEDSGIGVDSELLAGTERYLRHRESFQFNGFEVRPSAAQTHRRSRSVESMQEQAEDPTLLELERNQQDLTKRLKRMIHDGRTDTDVKVFAAPKQLKTEVAEVQDALPSSHRSELSSPKRNLTRPCLRRHSSGELQVGTKVEDAGKGGKKKVDMGVLKTAPPPCPSPLPVPLTPKLHGGRNSVKRLINTFSSKVKASQSQDLSYPPVHLQRARNHNIPFKPTGGNKKPIDPSDSNINNSQTNFKTSSRFEDQDMDILPPPPPEVLMDNSYDHPPHGEVGTCMAKKDCSTLPQRSTIYQRLRSSVQTMTVLPSRASLQSGSLIVPPEHPVQQEECQTENESTQDSELDPEMEEAASLYRQARKIIHLRDSTESPTKKSQVGTEPKKSSPIRAGIGTTQGSTGLPEMGTPSMGASSQTITTTPASRSCILPGATDIRNLDSAKAEDSSSCKLPSLPSGQGGLVSHASLKWRAPILPVYKATKEDSSENSRIQAPSKSFSEACSIFSPSSALSSEARRGPETWTPCSSSVLPRPWGDSSHTRLPVSIRSPQPFIRHNCKSQLPKMSLTPSAIMSKSQSVESPISQSR